MKGYIMRGIYTKKDDAILHRPNTVLPILLLQKAKTTYFSV